MVFWFEYCDFRGDGWVDFEFVEGIVSKVSDLLFRG